MLRCFCSDVVKLYAISDQTARDQVHQLEDHRDIGWLRVDMRPIKHALSTHASKWIWTFTKYLSDQVWKDYGYTSGKPVDPLASNQHAPNLGACLAFITIILDQPIDSVMPSKIYIYRNVKLYLFWIWLMLAFFQCQSLVTEINNCCHYCLGMFVNT